MRIINRDTLADTTRKLSEAITSGDDLEQVFRGTDFNRKLARFIQTRNPKRKPTNFNFYINL